MTASFVRHAQSVFNATGLRVRDPHLTDAGRAAARAMQPCKVDVVICSPLAREPLRVT